MRHAAPTLCATAARPRSTATLPCNASPAASQRNVLHRSSSSSQQQRQRAHVGPAAAAAATTPRARRCQPGQRIACRAASDKPEGAGSSSPTVFQGRYGPWSIEPADVAEVWSYRLGLSAAVAAFVGAAGICASADGDGQQAASSAAWLLNSLCLLGAAGLGVSLTQIHIYVTPIKRALQLLGLAGVAGGAWLALSHAEQPLPLQVMAHPWTIWLVGPAAAAVTGVAIKEGLCYGKPEAAVLAALLPLLCLSHLSGVVPGALQAALALGVCGAGSIFAARKYVQPIKDDIGDKSVFEFRKLPKAQQQQILLELQGRQ